MGRNEILLGKINMKRTLLQCNIKRHNKKKEEMMGLQILMSRKETLDVSIENTKGQVEYSKIKSMCSDHMS